MKRFAQLFRELDQTTKTTKKVHALASFFDEAEAEDKVWAIALLSHKRPKRTVSTTYLRTWAAEMAEIPDWLFEDAYHTVGDLAETIALLIKQENKIEKSIAEWIDYLQALKGQDPEDIKPQIAQAWKGLDNIERFIFNKLLTGGFRVGVSQKLMVKGLSKSTGIEENALAHKLMGDWDPFTITFDQLLYEQQEDFEDAKPYPFFLAYALEDVEKELGHLEAWIAEYKWDGIRGQIIQRNGLVSIWSRGEELVTDKFPELAEMAQNLPDGTVLDGEVLPWKEGKVMNFQALQTRLGRKTVSKKLMNATPLHFMAYDVLEYEGNDVRERPLSQRKEMLHQVVDTVQDERLMESAVITTNNLEKLEGLKTEAREIGAEGLMLKKLEAPYEVGRKKGGWYKWKVDPYTIDAVLTYGMKGHGRRANLHTDYTFGLWQDGELVTFAKAYSGLTDVEFREVDKFIRKNTLERFGPVRQVKPELVFELAFEGIALSKRHKSGVAVRFPRMVRWRHDKKPEDANSLDDLKKMAVLETEPLQQS